MLINTSGADIHVLYVDGDFDDVSFRTPRAAKALLLCGGLLTHDSPFWVGPWARPPRCR